MIPILSKARIALCVILFAGATGPSTLWARDPVAPAPDQIEPGTELDAIRRAVAAYQAAMGARDAERAASLVSQQSFDYYRDLLFWSMYGAEDELSRLDVMEMFLVLRLRQRLRPEEMKAVEGDGRAAYLLVVRRGSDGDTGFASADIVAIARHENHGRVKMRMPGRGEFLLFVLREADRWTMDLPATMAHVNRGLRNIPRERQVRLMLGLGSREELASLFAPPFPDGPTTDPGYFFLRGSMRLQSNRFEEALADFDRAIAGDPNNAAWYEIRGDLRLVLGRTETALQDYDRSLELKPGNPGAHVGRARVFGARESYADAVVEANRALLSDPFYDDALLVRGTARAGQQEFERAEADFTRYIERHPLDSDGHLYRADLRWQLHRRAEAVADAEEAFRLEGDNLTVLKTLARYYVQTGTRLSEVPLMTFKCRQRFSDDQECLNLESEARYRMGELEEAGRLSRYILKLKNLNPRIREEAEARLARIEAAAPKPAAESEQPAADSERPAADSEGR